MSGYWLDSLVTDFLLRFTNWLLLLVAVKGLGYLPSGRIFKRNDN